MSERAGEQANGLAIQVMMSRAILIRSSIALSSPPPDEMYRDEMMPEAAALAATNLPASSAAAAGWQRAGGSNLIPFFAGSFAGEENHGRNAEAAVSRQGNDWKISKEGKREGERAGFHNHISMEVFSKPIASTLSRGPARPANPRPALSPSANRAARLPPGECRPRPKARETRLVPSAPRGAPPPSSFLSRPLQQYRRNYSARKHISSRRRRPRPTEVASPARAAAERISRPAKETESAIESSERSGGAEP